MQLAPGELCLIQADDPALILHFSELCLGLLPAESGAVRLFGFD